MADMVRFGRAGENGSGNIKGRGEAGGKWYRVGRKSYDADTVPAVSQKLSNLR